MVQKINKGSDIYDTITGDIANVEHIYYYTTDITKKFEPYWIMSEDEESLDVYIDAEHLDALDRGQLRCRIEVSIDDEHYEDEKYDNIIDKGLNCILR